MKVTVESADIGWETKYHSHDSWDSCVGPIRSFLPEGKHVLQLTAEVDEFSPEELTGAFIGRDQELYITRHKSAGIHDTFNECCERAKEGDTNALGALPYLAERLISQAR